MKPFAGRTIDHDKPVQVYRNLNKGGWSVRQGGLVVAHTDEIALSNCTMHVSQAGRQRVVSTRRKCVHAYISGTVAPAAMATRPLHYNPYQNCSFVNEKGDPVERASSCVFKVGVHYNK